MAQPFIPPLMFFATPRTLFIILIVAGWVWSLIQYRTVHANLACIGCTIVVFLKWPSALLCGVLFLARGQYGLAALSAFWPVVTLGLMGLVPGGLIGVVEKKFIAQLQGIPESLLFEESAADWSYSIATYLTPLIFLAAVCGAWYLWMRLFG